MNSIKKMIADGKLVDVHPGAEADLPKLNDILKSYDNYIPELIFNGYKIDLNGSIQFTYDHPDTYSDEEELLAKELLQTAINDLKKMKEKV